MLVEHSLNAGRDVISLRQSSLKAETIEALVPLHSWLHAEQTEGNTLN